MIFYPLRRYPRLASKSARSSGWRLFSLLGAKAQAAPTMLTSARAETSDWFRGHRHLCFFSLIDSYGTFYATVSISCFTSEIQVHNDIP